MDDFEGREEAERRALTVTGTLGVLETAAIRGLIDLPSVLAQLQATTFYASQRLYDEVLARDAARKSRPPTDGR
jgi:predicted nucleic acid-binding protein